MPTLTKSNCLEPAGEAVSTAPTVRLRPAVRPLAEEHPGVPRLELGNPLEVRLRNYTQIIVSSRSYTSFSRKDGNTKF